jgi:O-methyltransferase
MKKHAETSHNLGLGSFRDGGHRICLGAGRPAVSGGSADAASDYAPHWRRQAKTYPKAEGGREMNAQILLRPLLPRAVIRWAQGFFLKYDVLITSPLLYVDPPIFTAAIGGNYVRHCALDLVSREIVGRNLPGAVAELGVYRGDFAALVNKLFSDRSLYLFDTFTGFLERDILAEQVGDDRGVYSKRSEVDVGGFSDTSVDLVMKKMAHPEKCVIRQGEFPETTSGLEDVSFAFCSIDVDLFRPTMQGLEFFYRRLSPGGYIFVHDYNNRHFRGVQAALRQFCAREEIAFFPLPDVGGTAVINKPLLRAARRLAIDPIVRGARARV